MELKDIVSHNIVELRKQNKWTQAELAEKLNYTDKAISKWERGESLPEITTLKQIADLFNCTVDLLLTEDGYKDKSKFSIPRVVKINRRIIAAIASLVIWIIATVVFVYSYIYIKNRLFWEAFIWAVPVNCIVLFVLLQKWRIKKPKIFVLSLLIWSFLLAVYLSTISYQTWLVFIIGIPVQALIILIYCLK